MREIADDRAGVPKSTITDSGGALDERARQALSRYRGRAWAWVSGSFVLLVLFIGWVCRQPLGVVGLLQGRKLRKHLKHSAWVTVPSRYASFQNGRARVQLPELALPGRGSVVARAGGPYVSSSSSPSTQFRRGERPVTWGPSPLGLEGSFPIVQGRSGEPSASESRVSTGTPFQEAARARVAAGPATNR